MTAYVLGGTVYEAFTDITDTISSSYDSVNYGMTSYTVTAPFAPSSVSSATYTGPGYGTKVCGARTYTSSCPLLTIGWNGVIHPYLALTATLDS
jgi:hypothetical protein